MVAARESTSPCLKSSQAEEDTWSAGTPTTEDFATNFVAFVESNLPLLRLVARQRVVGSALRCGDPEDAIGDAILLAWEHRTTNVKRVRNWVSRSGRSMRSSGRRMGSTQVPNIAQVDPALVRLSIFG
jgi:hypothetical protein